MAYELNKRGLHIERQKPQPVEYDDLAMGDLGCRLDLLVEGKFVVEIKSVESILDVQKAQLLIYLRMSKCKLGFLINFNVALLKNGVKRMIQGLALVIPEPSSCLCDYTLFQRFPFT